MRNFRIMRALGLMLLLVAVLPLPAVSGYQDSIDKTFNVHEGGTLTLTSDLGSINVTTGAGDKVKVTIIREVNRSGRRSAEKIFEDLNISMEQQGNDVIIETEYEHERWGLFSLFNKRLRLKYEIVVPETYNIDLKTSGGKITVNDNLNGSATCRTSGGSIGLNRINGSVNAKTSGGKITLAGASGNAELKTSGGSINIGAIDGTVNAKTSGGSIRIESSGGDVHARTSGGSIKVDEVMGYIDASTSGGSISAYVSRQPASDCRLTTSGGSITMYMNPNSKVSINAKTSGGSVRTQLPVMITGELKKNRLNADINGGGPEMYLRTSGGGITLNSK